MDRDELREWEDAADCEISPEEERARAGDVEEERDACWAYVSECGAERDARGEAEGLVILHEIEAVMARKYAARCAAAPVEVVEIEDDIPF